MCFDSSNLTAVKMAERFASLSKAQIDEQNETIDNENTEKVIKKHVLLVRTYLEAIKKDPNFEKHDIKSMAEELKLFFANVRNKKGEMYKLNTYNQIVYAVSVYLKKSNIDFKNDTEFQQVHATIKKMKKKTCKEGKGTTEHKEPIAKEDLKILYDHPFVFSPETPAGLQMKVWFEVILYLCRRGRENQRQMTKSTFTVGKDAKRREYVFQREGESDKNHQEDSSRDDTIGEGRMYSQLQRCPVQSFNKYISKLNPKCNDLWQQPKESYNEDDAVWYNNVPLGKNTLGKMMAKISKLANLSQIYTNHCVRATSITTLDEAGLEARHIMRITGHK